MPRWSAPRPPMAGRAAQDRRQDDRRARRAELHPGRAVWGGGGARADIRVRANRHGDRAQARGSRTARKRDAPGPRTGNRALGKLGARSHRTFRTSIAIRCGGRTRCTGSSGTCPDKCPYRTSCSSSRCRPRTSPASMRRCKGPCTTAIPYVIQHRVIRPDGSERIVEERSTVLRDAAGRPVPHGRHRARRHRAPAARGAAPPGAEDGSGRPPGGRNRARLQQPAHRHPRIVRAAARAARTRSSRAGGGARKSARRRCGRPTSPASCSRSAASRSSSRRCSISATS